MSVNDPRHNTAKGAGGTSDVKLIEVKVGAGSGLSVDLPKKDGGSYALTSERITFSATVEVAATAEGEWTMGWIQTIYPCSQSVTYQNPDGTVQGNMTSTVGAAEADGVSQEDTGHWAWNEPNPDTCLPGKPVTVHADDQPNVPFSEPYNGRKGAEWIKGWNAIATSGRMNFCTWLVAEAPNKNIEYLYYVVWHVDFGATLKNGKIVKSTGGLAVTEKGEGKGPFEPTLCPKVIQSDEHPYLPDQALVAAKPAGQ